MSCGGDDACVEAVASHACRSLKHAPVGVIHDDYHVNRYMTNIMNTVKSAEEENYEGEREQVAEDRRTILEAASQLFRERGYGAVTVAETMKAAGLTHGGFYGYFASKDELIAGALADVLSDRPWPRTRKGRR
jgi:hypothetical protein